MELLTLTELAILKSGSYSYENLIDSVNLTRTDILFAYINNIINARYSLNLSSKINDQNLVDYFYSICPDGTEILNGAIKSNDIERVRKIIKPTNVGYSSIVLAIETGNTELAALVILNCNDINIIENIHDCKMETFLIKMYKHRKLQNFTNAEIINDLKSYTMRLLNYEESIDKYLHNLNEKYDLKLY